MGSPSPLDQVLGNRSERIDQEEFSAGIADPGPEDGKDLGDEAESTRRDLRCQDIVRRSGELFDLTRREVDEREAIVSDGDDILGCLEQTVIEVELGECVTGEQGGVGRMRAERP